MPFATYHVVLATARVTSIQLSIWKKLNNISENIWEKNCENLELPRCSCQTIQLSSSGQVALPVTIATQYSVVKIFVKYLTTLFVKISWKTIVKIIVKMAQKTSK